MTRTGTWVLATLSLAAYGCAADVGSSESPVVYGNDDRTDVFAHPDPAMQTLARRSIVALVTSDALSPSGSGFVLSSSVRTAGEIPRSDGSTLCDDVRFRDQPSASFCSGTLIGPDLVLTVGHCLTNQRDCSNTRFVFDYLYTADGELATLEADDVYTCSAQVVRNGSLDYAIWRLDRPVSGDHGPAPVARTRAVFGNPLAMLGFGDGIPLKIDTGGLVISSDNTTFHANVDAFAGNSGSGVFVDGQVVGMLSQGETDFTFDGARGCYVVNMVPDGSLGEQIVHADLALYAYCQSNDDDATLCPAEDTWDAGAHKLGCSASPGSSSAPPFVVSAFLGALLLVARRRVLVRSR